MKKLMIGLVMLLVFLTAVAEADEYKVRKGDWLEKIARKYSLTWPELFKANTALIKNPDYILPGWILTIPVRSVKEKAVAVKYWDSFNTDPYGDRDPVQAINDFDRLPEQVRRIAIDTITQGMPGQNMAIERGHHFEQMRFGHGMWNNVVARLANHPEMESLNAEVWPIEFGDSVYYIAKPKKCVNWAWWSEKLPPRFVEKKAVQVKKMMLLPLLPPPLVKITRSVPGKTFQPRLREYMPDFEAYFNVEYSWPLDGRNGYNLNAGANTRLYLTRNYTSQGEYNLGIGAIWGGWLGETVEGLKYEGYNLMAGPVARYFDGKYKIVASVQFGRQADEGHLNGFRFHQDTKLTHLDISFDRYVNDPRSVLRKYSVFGFSNIDTGRSKRSSFNGQLIPQSVDPAIDKTLVGAGGRLYFNLYRGWMAGPDGRVIYSRGSHALDKRLGVFLADPQEYIAPGIAIGNISGSKFPENGNYGAVNAALDVGLLGKLFYGKVVEGRKQATIERFNRMDNDEKTQFLLNQIINNKKEKEEKKIEEKEEKKIYGY